MPSDPLETRAKRGLVRKLWFETPTIGIFKELATATNIPPEEVLHHIKNAGKKNAKMRTYLKPRHLELMRILYFEGMSFQKIADCLSNPYYKSIYFAVVRDTSVMPPRIQNL